MQKAHSSVILLCFISLLSSRGKQATDNIFGKHTLQWLTTIVHSIDQVLPTKAIKGMSLEWSDAHLIYL